MGYKGPLVYEDEILKEGLLCGRFIVANRIECPGLRIEPDLRGRCSYCPGNFGNLLFELPD